MNITKSVDLAVDVCKPFEGFRSKPYLCPAGVWTIGYGSTRTVVGGSLTRVSSATPPIDKNVALALLENHMANLVPTVLKLCPTLDTGSRLASLMDFVYNMGETRLRGSTLRKCIAVKDWDGAVYQMHRWVYGKEPKTGVQKKLPGLILRRAVNAKMLLEVP